MKKSNQSKDHPEVTEIKNICNVSPGTKTTKDICKKMPRNKNHTKTKSDQ